MISIRRNLLTGKKSKNLIGTITSIEQGWTGSNGVVAVDSTAKKRGMILPAVSITPSSTYTLSWNGYKPYSMSACEYDSSDQFVVRTHTAISSNTSMTFTTRSNSSKVKIQFYTQTADTGSVELMKSIKPMLELGNQHTSYEP